MKAYLEIEMPACINCRFCQAGDSTSYCLAQSHELERGGWYMHHIKWDEGIGYEAQKTWREKTCPLIPVPPHGDLIERDALMKEFEKAQRTMEKHGREYSCSFMSSSQEISTEWYCVEDMLENAPTILPAEEGET